MYKKKSAGCAGRGDIACPTCNADQERGFYKENQMSQCPACYGRGLIAHRDGSDTMSAVSSSFNSRKHKLSSKIVGYPLQYMNNVVEPILYIYA